MTPSRRRLAGALLVVIIAVVVALLQTGGDDGGDGGPAPVAAGATTAAPAATSIASPSTAAPSAPAGSGTTRTTTLAPTRTTRAAGLQLVALSSLPDEAADTWALIEADGPFPYDRDGVVFENREHDFPQRILYWLDGEGRLHARIEGPAGSGERAMEWVWSRLPD